MWIKRLDVREEPYLTCPRFGSQVLDLPVGGVWQPREDVAQIGLGIDAATAAAFDDGIKDGAALTGLGFADEQPVLFSECGWPDGIFHEILIDLDAAIAEVNAEREPKVQRVSEGQPHAAARQVAPFHFEPRQDTMKPSINGFGLMGAHGGAKLRPTSTFPQLSFNTVKMPDLAHEPAGHERVLVTRRVHLSSHMRPTPGEPDVLLVTSEARVRRQIAAADQSHPAIHIVGVSGNDATGTVEHFPDRSLMIKCD